MIKTIELNPTGLVKLVRVMARQSLCRFQWQRPYAKVKIRTAATLASHSTQLFFTFKAFTKEVFDEISYLLVDRSILRHLPPRETLSRA